MGDVVDLIRPNDRVGDVVDLIRPNGVMSWIEIRPNGVAWWIEIRPIVVGGVSWVSCVLTVVDRGEMMGHVRANSGRQG